MARNELSIMATRITKSIHDNTLISESKDWINETILDIHRKTDNRYLIVTDTFTSVSAQIEYAFSVLSAVTASSEVDKLLSIRDQTNDCRLSRVSSLAIYDVDPDPENSGDSIPQFYYVKDEIFGLVSQPSGAFTYSVDYKKRATDLAADTDIPDLPLEWTDIILLGAEYRGLRFLRRTDWTAVYQTYQRELAQALKDMNSTAEVFRHMKPGLGNTLRTPRIIV